MISKDSDTTKEFVKRVFEVTHKRWYVDHAINMIKSEDNMKKVIDYLKDKTSVEWQDLEYFILMI